MIPVPLVLHLQQQMFERTESLQNSRRKIEGAPSGKKIYEAANCTDGSLVVIFYFTEEEKRFAEKVIEDSGYKSAIDESIFLIDCRKDNKKSASIA